MSVDTPPVRTLVFGESARKKILKGISITAQAVVTTLGSKGRNVAIERNWGAPVVIHDGVTVARSIVLKDPYENMGSQLVIAAAQKTNDAAGDGTTTATLLTHAIAVEGMKLVSAGMNPMVLRKGIEWAVEETMNYLRKVAKPIKTKEEMVQIAQISAADKTMGELIATAVQKVGENGVVTVQESSGSTVEVEYKKGMEFDRGYISPYMMTSLEKQEAVIEPMSARTEDYPYVVIVNQKLHNHELVQIFENIYKTDQRARVLVIADDFEPEAMQTLVLTKIRAGKILVGVRSPEFGDHRTNLLNDLAIVTGATVLGGQGVPIEKVELSHIGRAERIIVSAHTTTIIGGQGKKEHVDDRIAAIKTQMDQAKDEFVKDKYEGRLAKIVGGVAVISVGAPSEAEMKEKKERVFDAVNATKAAIAEGVVAGGGVALAKASTVLKKKILDLPDDLRVGAKIVQDAITYPLLKLVENSGAENPGFILGTILAHTKNPHYGYNVDSEHYEDMVASGIIDPVKVTRHALVNAASTATMLLTTEVMIAFERENPEKKEEDQNGIGQFQAV